MIVRSLRSRLVLLLIGLVVSLAVSLAAPAQTPDLLSVDQAFAPTAKRLDDHTIAVHWSIADGYYLYRHAFGFHLPKKAAARLGKPVIPDGERHDDEYFGPVQTYRHSVTVRLPVTGDTGDIGQVEVQYQGCADAGLCYPPQTKTLSLGASGPPARANAGPPAPDAAFEESMDLAIDWASKPSRAALTLSTTPARNRVTRLADRLADAPAWATLSLFLVFGIGLAFTPCILPMIPIVAGLIGSRDVSRGRAFALATSYVLAMATAYAVFGVVAGYFGANLQAVLQRPAVLWPFAALFFVLGAASFGWFDLQLPGAWQQRLSPSGRRQRGLLGAGVLGFAAALIAGPCLAPPLAGALLYISTSGDLWIGGAALFCLGLGMGVPLIALAIFGSAVLPRAGQWMNEIRIFFGVMLIGVGLWLALRLAGDTTALATWGLFALVYGCHLSTRPTTTTSAGTIKRLACGLLFGYAVLAGMGLAIGNGRPARPLAGLAGTAGVAPAVGVAETGSDAFVQVHDAEGLAKALAAARNASQPALVDVYADWCVECVRMKNGVFQTPRAQAALADVAAIELDVTGYTKAQRTLLAKLGVFGPPTLLFYDAHGQRRTGLDHVGTIDLSTLISTLETLDSNEPPRS